MFYFIGVNKTRISLSGSVKTQHMAMCTGVSTFSFPRRKELTQVQIWRRLLLLKHCYCLIYAKQHVKKCFTISSNDRKRTQDSNRGCVYVPYRFSACGDNKITFCASVCPRISMREKKCWKLPVSCGVFCKESSLALLCTFCVQRLHLCYRAFVSV